MSHLDMDKSTLTIDRFNNIDAETKHKIALKEEDEAKALLLYYRDKIKTLDSEIHEWASKLEQMEAEKDISHSQAQELQRKREEVADLQRSISESKLSQQNERLESLKLKRENDYLRLRELQDKRKIYELMVLNEPGEKENTFYKDLRPDAKKEITNDLSIQFNKKNSKGSDKGKSGSQKFTKTGTEIMKAIYLPNEQLDTFTVENDNLKIRLEEERIAFEEHIRVLNEQISIREEELARRQEADLDKINELSNRHSFLTDLKSKLAKEFFSFRMEVNERKNRLLQEQDELKMIYNGLTKKVFDHEKKVDTEHKIAKEMVEKKAEEYTNKYRGQIKTKDEKLFLLKDQYENVQRTCLDTLKNLEGSLTKLANEYQTLDQRRMLEKEDFKEKTLALDKKIRQFQRKYFNGQTIKLIGDKSKMLKFDVNQMMREEDIHDAQEEVDHYEDEEEGNTTLNSEEFSLIKHQLAELENKLDRSRKMGA